MTRDTVTISGHYGDFNLGDDAIALTLVRALETNPTYKYIRVLTLRHRPDMADWGTRTKQFRVNRVSKGLSFIRLLCRTRIFIVGGGGILQDATSLANLVLHTTLPLVARLFGAEIVVLGVGIGPLRRGISRILVGLLLTRCKTIVVRDEDSARYARLLGTRHRVIHIIPDLAWVSPRARSHRDASAQGRLVISLRPPVGSSSHRASPTGSYISSLVQLVTLLQRSGRTRQFPIFFLSTHPLQDTAIIDRLSPYLAANSCANLIVPRSVEQLSQSLYSGDIVVAMRLHAQIFAVAKGLPTIFLGYDEKVRNLAEQLDMTRYFVRFPLRTQDMQALAARFNELVDDYDTVSATLTVLSESLRAQASETLEFLVHNDCSWPN